MKFVSTKITFLAFSIAGFAAADTSVVAIPRPRIARPIDNNQRTTLNGSLHPKIRAAKVIGHPDGSNPLGRIILSLKPSADAKSRLEKLLAEQQDPASANFQKWLTPTQFGEQFGLAEQDLSKLRTWLETQGLAIDSVSPSRLSINVSGTVSQVEKAFGTVIQDVEVDGETRRGNVKELSIPSALEDVLSGAVSLHNLPHRSYHKATKVGTVAAKGKAAAPNLLSSAPTPQFTYSTHYLAPGDFATIYNVKPLYSAGLDGQGVKIAIVGRTDVDLSDVALFRSLFKLPANLPEVIHNGPPPGISDGDEFESQLDLQWAGAVAKNASIKFVTSASTDTTDGIDLSAQYVVDNNVAPIVSTSYGLDEVFVGEAGLNFYNNLWAQAAAQGITSFVSSGDAGAGSIYTYDQAVNGLASTPYNVAVGGTQFEDAVGDWWSPTNNPDGSSALSYIPEAAWNDGDGGATGGGASLYFGQPSWQVAPGVPQNGQRNLPDVSLTASTHDGYLVAFWGDLYVVGGTSASSPSFAGLLALAVQKTGRPQGNVNPVFYRLGNAQYTGTGAAIFHDITIGDNAIPGTPGWPATPGYDLTTGLGSVDAAALIGAFAPNPLKATYKVESDWGTGFEGQIYLTNTGSKAITGWTVELVFNGGFAIANAWNGDFNKQGSTVTITPKSWNNILYPGQQAVFGYIGTYSGQKPQLVSLTLK